MELLLDTPDKEWQETRNKVAMHFLGKDAEEFTKAYLAGEYPEDIPGLMAVLALFPELD